MKIRHGEKLKSMKPRFESRQADCRAHFLIHFPVELRMLFSKDKMKEVTDSRTSCFETYDSCLLGGRRIKFEPKGECVKTLRKQVSPKLKE